MRKHRRELMQTASIRHSNLSLVIIANAIGRRRNDAVSNGIDVGTRYDAYLVVTIENNQSGCITSRKKRVSLRPQNSPCPDKTRLRLPTKLTVPRVSRLTKRRRRISLRSINIKNRPFGYFGYLYNWVSELFVRFNFVSVRLKNDIMPLVARDSSISITENLILLFERQENFYYNMMGWEQSVSQRLLTMLRVDLSTPRRSQTRNSQSHHVPARKGGSKKLVDRADGRCYFRDKSPRTQLSRP